MQRGQRLKIGDTIGVVAPAGKASEDAILRGVRTLESMGYRVRLCKNAFRNWYGYAGDDMSRAKEINTFFQDPQVNAILCMRGGYGSIRLLEAIDFVTIRTHPKIFVGYSDITLLHLALNQHADLITFHGPMLTSNIADDFDTMTQMSFLKAVADGFCPYTIVNPTGSPISVINSGIAEGIVCGGNLITLLSTLGTPYEPDLTDKILFLEEISEPAYRIDRALTQLLLAGKLDRIRGFILGDFKDCEPGSTDAMTLEEIFHDRLAGFNVPIVSNLRSGHCRPMVTLPIGAKARIGDPDAPLQLLEAVVD